MAAANYGNPASQITAAPYPTYTLGCHWAAAVDPESQIAFYEVAIGRSAGATDIMNWYNVGTNRGHALTRAFPVLDGMYVCSVRACTAEFLCTTSISNGTYVDGTAPSITDAWTRFNYKGRVSGSLMFVPGTADAVVQWGGFVESKSRITRYEVSLAVLTLANLADRAYPSASSLSWYNAGDAVSLPFSALVNTLALGQRQVAEGLAYVAFARAVNIVDRTSNYTYSAALMLDASGPVVTENARSSAAFKLAVQEERFAGGMSRYDFTGRYGMAGVQQLSDMVSTLKTQAASYPADAYPPILTIGQPWSGPASNGAGCALSGAHMDIWTSPRLCRDPASTMSMLPTRGLPIHSSRLRRPRQTSQPSSHSPRQI